MLQNRVHLTGSGRKTALTKEEKQQLVNCIKVLCPLRHESIHLVQEYVTINNKKTPFKYNRPKKNWLRGFMDG